MTVLLAATIRNDTKSDCVGYEYYESGISQWRERILSHFIHRNFDSEPYCSLVLILWSRLQEWFYSMSQLNQQMRERNHELRIRLAKKKKEDEIDRQLKLQVNFTHWKILGKLKLWDYFERHMFVSYQAYWRLNLLKWQSHLIWNISIVLFIYVVVGITFRKCVTSFRKCVTLYAH